MFIHINKTGGTSIEKALGIRVRTKHMTVKEIIEITGEEGWETAFRFTIVRNPWDRVLSQFKFRKKRNIDNLATDDVSFREWVKKVFLEKDPRYFTGRPVMFYPQVEWLKDIEGNIHVDYIGRFEHLEESFREICDKIGVRASLPHINATDPTGDYRQYYDDATAAIVADYFKEDIETFGYRF